MPFLGRPGRGTRDSTDRSGGRIIVSMGPGEIRDKRSSFPVCPPCSTPTKEGSIFQCAFCVQRVHARCLGGGADPDDIKFYRGHPLLSFTCRLCFWGRCVDSWWPQDHQLARGDGRSLCRKHHVHQPPPPPRLFFTFCPGRGAAASVLGSFAASFSFMEFFPTPQDVQAFTQRSAWVTHPRRPSPPACFSAFAFLIRLPFPPPFNSPPRWPLRIEEGPRLIQPSFPPQSASRGLGA